MRKRRQPQRRERPLEQRDVKRRDQRGTTELRVIQGGSMQGRKGGERGGREVARRRKPPGRVRRRRRMTMAVLVVLATGIVVYVLLGPVTRMLDSRREVARAEAQLAEERSRTTSLEERKAWDMTDAFVEWEARKMGYVKPGEIPIIVLDYHEEEKAPEDMGGNTLESAPEDTSENAVQGKADDPSP